MARTTAVMASSSKISGTDQSSYHRSQCHSKAVAERCYTHLDTVDEAIHARDVLQKATKRKFIHHFLL
jgi:hypothetical protein